MPWIHERGWIRTGVGIAQSLQFRGSEAFGLDADVPDGSHIVALKDECLRVNVEHVSQYQL